MRRRLAVALACVGAAISVGHAGGIRQGQAAPTPPKNTSESLGECSLRGRPVMGADVSLFDSSLGGRARARFTGRETPLVIAAMGQGKGERVMVRTGFGSGGFRLEGYVDTAALPVTTQSRVSVIDGHLWLDEAQPVRVLRHEVGRFEVELELDGELSQSVRAWASCNDLALSDPPYHASAEPPPGARGYVMKRASLELFTSWDETRASVLVLQRASRSGGALLFGTERKGGLLRVHYAQGIVIDAWAREDDLQALPAGETLDQLPATPRRSSPRLKLAQSPRTLRLKRDAEVRQEASSKSSIIGYVESASELFVVQSIAGWTSVLPKPLTVAPLEDHQFWIRTHPTKKRLASP